jgi:hypothetical protein
MDDTKVIKKHFRRRELDMDVDDNPYEGGMVYRAYHENLPVDPGLIVSGELGGNSDYCSINVGELPPWA